MNFINYIFTPGHSSVAQTYSTGTVCLDVRRRAQIDCLLLRSFPTADSGVKCFANGIQRFELVYCVVQLLFSCVLLFGLSSFVRFDMRNTWASKGHLH